MNDTAAPALAAVASDHGAGIQKTPVEGLSARVGEHIEKINRIGAQLLAEFERYEGTREKLESQHRVTLDADFGPPINSALANYRQMKKDPGRP